MEFGTLHVLRPAGERDDGSVTSTFPPLQGAQIDWRALVCSYDWPCDEALRVVAGPTPACPSGESGGRWWVSNGPNEGGFQVNIDAHANLLQPGESLFDPVVNVRVAYAIWTDSGGNWSQWSCAP